MSLAARFKGDGPLFFLHFSWLEKCLVVENESDELRERAPPMSRQLKSNCKMPVRPDIWRKA